MSEDALTFVVTGATRGLGLHTAGIAGLSIEVEGRMGKSSVEGAGEALRAQWQARLDRFARDGGSVAAFCAAEGVPAWSLYRWRRKLGAEAGKVPTRTAVVKSAARDVDTSARSAGPRHIK